TGVFSGGLSPAAAGSPEFAHVVAWASGNGIAYACEIPCGPGGLRDAAAKNLAAIAQSAGLRIKLLTGVAAARTIGSLASEIAALSVDIAGKVHPADIALLGSSASIATLLPGLSHAMRTAYPPGRELIDHG